MMLMLEKVKGGLCHAIHRYAKENNKHMGQNYDKALSYHICRIWMQIICMDGDL